jgi:chaperonin GroES
MSTTLEPTGDRLFVEPIEEEKILKSGLILPDNVGEKPHRGIIIAMGPLVGVDQQVTLEKAGMALGVDDTPPLKLGDEVLYSKYGGTEMKVDLREVVMLRESDVFCRVVEQEDVVDVEEHFAGEAYLPLTIENLRAAGSQLAGPAAKLVVAPDLEAEAKALGGVYGAGVVQIEIDSELDRTHWLLCDGEGRAAKITPAAEAERPTSASSEAPGAGDGSESQAEATAGASEAGIEPE